MNFSEFADTCVAGLLDAHRYSTAHLYRNASNSFSRYLGGRDIEFSDFTCDAIALYEQYLHSAGKCNNTISTYMRMLRSIYNKGVRRNLAPAQHDLFGNVYTGIDVSSRHSFSHSDINSLMCGKPVGGRLADVRLQALVIFQMCGIPYVDLAHLTADNIKDDVLSYSRHKTGTSVEIGLPAGASANISRLSRGNGGNRYLFGILSGRNSPGSISEYREYNNALRRFNCGLRRLAVFCGIRSSVSSYVLRHTWATVALQTGSPIELISQVLGHKSIRTTQIYLDRFSINRITEAGNRTCEYAMKP